MRPITSALLETKQLDRPIEGLCAGNVSSMRRGATHLSTWAVFVVLGWRMAGYAGHADTKPPSRLTAKESEK